MAPDFLHTLSLARFAIFLRPQSDLYLPGYKGAAFRGGFGYVFKSIVCPTHGVDCIHARLGDPCVYSEVFESPVPKDSAVMRKYTFVPHPFVLTPPLDRRAHFTQDRELCVELVLVGRAIQWLAYFICTLEELGRRGIGPNRDHYRVERVESLDSPGEAAQRTVVYDGTLRRAVATPHVIRVAALSDGSSNGEAVALSFATPARLISSEHLATQLSFVTLFRSLLRRLALLAQFHCGATVSVEPLRELIQEAKAIRVKGSHLRWKDWERFSTRQQSFMKLGGLVGEISFQGQMGRFLPFLRAGELTHVGKATSFGLGKYGLHIDLRNSNVS
jgi:hypothetical protein